MPRLLIFVWPLDPDGTYALSVPTVTDLPMESTDERTARDSQEETPEAACIAASRAPYRGS